MTISTARRITYIVPCGAAKADAPTKARDLYTSAHFRFVLRTAEAMADGDRASGRPARVLIMSAEHGLVELDRILAPYDTTIADADSIPADVVTAQAIELGLAPAVDDDEDLGDEVYALLPGGYFERLSVALQAVYSYPQDVYEAAPGIGFQRGTCRSAATAYAA